MIPVNIREKFNSFETHWDPKIIGELNGQHVKLAKFQGEFVWHKHENEDELFLVIEGSFEMQFREKTVTVGENIMKKLYLPTREKWSDWLSKNHDKETELWLVFYRKEIGKPTIDYESAVEEALCYGWIDGLIKKLDDETYARRFTPRKDKSRWSETNKKRAAKIIKEGRITKFGLSKIEAAKKSGQWEVEDRPQIPQEIPPELMKAFETHPHAKKIFDGLSPSDRKEYIGWIYSAKRPDTKAKRVNESIILLEKKRKLGMK